MFLYHYYDQTIGPFRNLSDLSLQESNQILKDIRAAKPDVQDSKRHTTYMDDRLYYENIILSEFEKKLRITWLLSTVHG